MTLEVQGFDMDRSTPATQIDGGNGNWQIFLKKCQSLDISWLPPYVWLCCHYINGGNPDCQEPNSRNI